jgi:chlorobactene glucosyltransferase
MLATARHYRVTQLSCWPRVEMLSLAEQICMPMLSYVVYSMFPAAIQRLRMTEPSFGIAHGTCMLFHRATYQRLGAHYAVRASLFEDARMAQHWRRCSERGLCVDGRRLISVRMYTCFSEIWEGFEKNMFACCGTHLRFFTWIGLRFLFFQLPLVLAPFYTYYRTPLLALWLAFGAVMLQRLLLALYFRQPLWSVALHPLAEAGVLGVSLSSWLRIVTGRGVTWKGRVYRQVEEEALDPEMALDVLLTENEPEFSPTEL